MPVKLTEAQHKVAKAYRKELGTPQHIVNISRSYSTKALKTLAEVMEDSSQPVIARVRCAEILLERGYGKAPQAVLVADATSDAQRTGIHALSIMDRIAQLREAKDGPVTTDLEASEVTELPALPAPAAATNPADDPDSPI